MATIPVLDSTGTTQNIEKPNANGQATMANSRPVAVASDQSAIPTKNSPTTTSGAGTHHFLVSGATLNPTLVKVGAACINDIHLSNNSASWRYLKLFDLMNTPTIGTNVPIRIFGIPPGGVCNPNLGDGLKVGTGIAYGITANPPHLDQTPIGASEVVVSMTYT